MYAIRSYYAARHDVAHDDVACVAGVVGCADDRYGGGLEEMFEIDDAHECLTLFEGRLRYLFLPPPRNKEWTADIRVQEA